MSSDLLGIWTIYERPSDYPDGFIARLWLVGIGGVTRPTTVAVTAPTLAALRTLLPPGLHQLDRMPDDDPVIVEVWI